MGRSHPTVVVRHVHPLLHFTVFQQHPAFTMERTGTTQLSDCTTPYRDDHATFFFEKIAVAWIQHLCRDRTPQRTPLSVSFCARCATENTRLWGENLYNETLERYWMVTALLLPLGRRIDLLRTTRTLVFGLVLFSFYKIPIDYRKHRRMEIAARFPLLQSTRHRRMVDPRNSNFMDKSQASENSIFYSF